MGTYEGIKVAGKTFTGTPNASLVQEVLDEVKFFMLLDHPNCHYLLGAKTTLDNGGILELTEVCCLLFNSDNSCSSKLNMGRKREVEVGRLNVS